MWGNARGWWISLFVLIVCVSALSFEQMQLEPNLNRIMATPGEYIPFVPAWPSPPVVEFNENAECSSLYQAASNSYDKTACVNWSLHPEGQIPTAIQDILDATHRTGSDVFLSHPEMMVNYQQYMGSDNLPALSNLFNSDEPPTGAGQLMENAALRIYKTNMADAQRFLQAEYAMGYKLYNERLSYTEYLDGMGLMGDAMSAMIICDGSDSQRGKELTQAMQALLDLDTNHVEPIMHMITSQKPAILLQNAGDIFAFSIDTDPDCKERLFRDEAILKMGRYRYNAETVSDQVAADRFINKLLADPNSDPVVRAAAQAAHDLSQEEYNQLH